MSEQQLGIRFGGISDPIAKQLRQQKFKFDNNEVQRFQKIADSILMLRIHSISSESDTARYRKKLLNKISSHVNKHMK